MPTLASSLLEFIMNLLRDPRAADEFNADPDAALASAGLSNVCSDDVDAIMPVIMDYAPVGSGSSFDREYNTGGNHGGNSGDWSSDNSGWGHGRDDDDDDDHGHGRGRDDDDDHGHGRGRDDDDDHGHGGGGRGDHDHDHAVQQLTHIVNNYSYTSVVDDRDTITDQSVNQNIWANGDVTQWFDNDAVVASGDHSIAAGGDADVDNSTGDEHNHSVNLTTGDVGGGIAIGNTDNSVEDSYNDDHSTNDDHSVEDSYNTDLDLDVDVTDSYNDNDGIDGDNNAVGNTDNSLDNVGNIDNSLDNVGNEDNDVTVGDVAIDASQDNDGIDVTTGDIAVDASSQENVGNDNSLDNVGNGNAIGNEDNDVIVQDNVVAVGNEDNDTTIGDIDAEFTAVDESINDSVVIADNDNNDLLTDNDVVDADVVVE